MDHAPLSLPIASLRRWTAALWSLTVARPPDLHFIPGHYLRLGLTAADGSVVWRPYSITSAPAAGHLEFLFSLVAGGPFSALLEQCHVGSPLLLDPRPQGLFLESQLAPGASLWFLATGSGIGPALALLREGSLLQRWNDVVVVHSVRHAAELACSADLATAAAGHPALHWLPVVTREPVAGTLQARIPQLVTTGQLQQAAGVALDPGTARVMVCGNPDFGRDMRTLLNERGFLPCRRGLAGSMLFESYWQPPRR